MAPALETSADKWPTDEWPTHKWRRGELANDVDHDAVHATLRQLGDKPAAVGVSLATLIVHRSQIVVEQYGPGTTHDTTLISWSMAKSITQAVLGLLVLDGKLDIDAPADVAEFATTDKAPITVRQLLEMRSGLQFVEDYVDDSVSDCLEMLFGTGALDHAHYAASLPLVDEPGTVWNYSSGTTNILARLAGQLIGGGEAGMRDFLLKRLFKPLGMASAEPKFDQVGTLVGSSYIYATARDFARFGFLYLHDGVWNGQRLLPQGWVDQARNVVSVDPDPPYFGYGAHWWIWRQYPGSMAAHGYEGQFTIVVPERDLVIVHLGKVPKDAAPPLVESLNRVIAAFPLSR